MALEFWLKFISYIAPKSKAFRLIIDKKLKQFFSGIASLPMLLQEHFANVFLQIFPNTTIYLLKWSEQFGFGTSQEVFKLVAEWKQQGKQSPNYLQQALIDNDFDLYVHEWWRSSSEKRPVQCGAREAQCGRAAAQCGGILDVPSTYPITRNPLIYVRSTQPNNLLVNSVQIATGPYTFDDKIYSAPAIDGQLQYYFYVGAETFGDFASIPINRKRELEKIIYKFKPCHQRCVLLIDFTIPVEVWENSPDGATVYENSPDGTFVIESTN